VSMTVHMKAVNVSPIENAVDDSPVGVVSMAVRLVMSMTGQLARPEL
jgi:hypothetical protein